jgi:poly-gamma-glutamate synthesis protein (capsule biosynthesis protein)
MQNQNNTTNRIVIAGDLLPSGKNIKLFEEGNAQAIFGEKIIDLFSKSDFSIFNLEGPLTDSSKAMEKTGPVIKASKGCIRGIKELGVKAVALANNHITDYQKEGFKDTVKLLDDNGIEYLGAGEKSENIKKSISLSLGNRKICIYNVSEQFYNVPAASIPGANVYDEYVVCNDIKELKQSHDYLIVIYHGGTEEFPYPTPLLRQHFHRMADCGADFITAQHTHCIGCYENYNGAYLLYGQGNFLFARMKNDMTKHGLITELVFSESNIAIKQYLVCVTSDDTLKYDESQDLTMFYKRGDELNDFETIEKKYQQFCYKAAIIKDRFLSSFRGDSLYYQFLDKLPGKLYKKHLLEKYNKEQLMRISKCLESERYAENMFACIQYMMGNNRTK